MNLFNIYENPEIYNINSFDNYLRIRRSYMDVGYLIYTMKLLIYKQEYHRICLYEKELNYTRITRHQYLSFQNKLTLNLYIGLSPLKARRSVRGLVKFGGKIG